MEFEYNKDTKRRAEIIGIVPDKAEDQYISFEDITAEQMKQLLDEKFLDPCDSQNYAPTAKEFYEFMDSHPGILAHGYIIGPKRSDYRVTIEGLSGVAASKDDLIDFMELCRSADELNFNKETLDVYSWWD